MGISSLLDKHTIITYGVPLLSLLISLSALAISLLGFLKARKTEASARRVGDRSRSAKHSAQQSIEMTLNALVALNRGKMEEAEHSLKEFKTRNPDSPEEFKKKIYLNSVEEYLKTFDNACMLYLEDRYDKERFIKEFRTEIRKIVERENYYIKLFDNNSESIKGKYRAIQRVYDKWENIEK